MTKPRKLTSIEASTAKLKPTRNTRRCKCGLKVKKAGSNYVHVTASGLYIYIDHKVILNAG